MSTKNITHDQEQIANTRLIAAAPELLAALEKIAERVDLSGGFTAPKYDRGECTKIARAAIAKAGLA